MVTGVYGGYFGAAQGVLLIGVLGSGWPRRAADQRDQERAGVIANGIAGILFVFLYDVNWWAAGASPSAR